MSVIESPSSAGLSAPASPGPNTVGLIGAILTGVSVCLLIFLFVLVGQLPDGIEEFQQLENDTPAQLRLLILGCTTAVLASVALLLCVIALFLPNRTRLLAATGTVISAAIVFGVFGVLILGAVMNPLQTAEETFTDPAPAASDQSP